LAAHSPVTRSTRGPSLDGQRVHGALQRADQSITTDCGCAATALAGRTLLLAAPASGRRCGGHTQRGGQDDLDAFAADLDGDALTFGLVTTVGLTGLPLPGLDPVVELGLDPPGVDVERLCGIG